MNTHSIFRMLKKLLILLVLQRGLNSRPLPYQGSALPLSYRSFHRSEFRCFGTRAYVALCTQIQNASKIKMFIAVYLNRVYHPYVPFSMAAPAPGSRTRNSWWTISTHQFMRSRPIDSPLGQSLSSRPLPRIDSYQAASLIL